MKKKRSLHDLRMAKGYTIEYVADYMGKSTVCIRNWEKLKARPDKANLQMLCNLYGITPDLLLIKS